MPVNEQEIRLNIFAGLVYNHFMNYRDIVQDIMKKVAELLRNSSISSGIVQIDHVGIFPQGDHDFEVLSGSIKKEGLAIKPTPNGVIYKLNSPIQTQEGKVYLVKIYAYDLQQKRIGSVDYQVYNFQTFKRDYLSTGSVEDVEDHDGEKLTVKDTNVIANFPENPAGKQFI